jgi:hypothetical protein
MSGMIRVTCLKCVRGVRSMIHMRDTHESAVDIDKLICIL